MTRATAFRLLTCAVAWGLLPVPAAGQVSSPATLVPGIVRGTVLDRADGAPIPDVLVEFQDSRQSTRTDDKGRFELRDVQPGTRTLYVSIVGFILVKRTVTVTAGEALEVTVHLSEGTGTYSENVTVTGERFREQEKAVPSQMVLGSADVQNLRSLVTNDPMRAVQVLPGVTTGDDFHSEFAVRGNPFSRLVFTLDGIPSSFLLHTIQNVQDGGSIAMLNGDILDGITLLNGSYPQRFGNRLGAELDFHMREGSRDRRQMRIGVSGTDASFVAEGPMAAKSGSWLFSIRQSYLQYLLQQIAPEENFGFGFADLQAKVVKDLSPRQRLEVTFVAGRSRLDDREPDPSEFEVIDGRNSAQIVHALWRYTPSPSLSITQRIGAGWHQFSNANPFGVKFDDGGGRDLTWRTDVTSVRSPRLTMEAGGQVQSQLRHDRMDSPGSDSPPLEVEGSSVHSMAYGQIIWSPTPRLAVVPGTLVDFWSRTSAGGVSPWLQASWKLSSSISLRGGTGLYRQYPGLEPSVLFLGRDLTASRAYHADFGIEQVLGQSRWQLTAYRREERDALRFYGDEERAVGEIVVRNMRILQTETVTGPPPQLFGWFNTLDGDATGLELLIQRKSTSGLIGWLSYSYGINRYRDRHTGETFDGDFDQQHTVNAYLLYRLTSRASLAVKWRSGSNFPMPGYWSRRDGGVFAGEQRNTERIPRYARLDSRLSYAFHLQGQRLTLFVEVINALGRENVRFTDGFTSFTGQVFSQFQPMIPRVPSGGILWEF